MLSPPPNTQARKRLWTQISPFGSPLMDFHLEIESIQVSMVARTPFPPPQRFLQHLWTPLVETTSVRHWTQRWRQSSRPITFWDSPVLSWQKYWATKSKACTNTRPLRKVEFRWKSWAMFQRKVGEMYMICNIMRVFCGYLVLRVGVHFPASYVLVDPGALGGVLISKPAVYNGPFLLWGIFMAIIGKTGVGKTHGKPVRIWVFRHFWWQKLLNEKYTLYTVSEVVPTYPPPSTCFTGVLMGPKKHSNVKTH